MSSGAMDYESSSVYIEPVYNAEFSGESSAGYDIEGSNDSSEFVVDDVSYDCAESFDESANQVDDCIDNLISDTVVEDPESHDSFSLALKIFNDRITVNLPESSDDLEPQKSNDVALQEVLDRLDREQKNVDAEVHELVIQNTFDDQVRELKAGIITASSDLNLLGESLKLLGAAIDKETNETIVKLFEDDTLEDEISISAQIMADFAASELEDIEMQSSSEVVFTLEQQLRFKNWTDEVKKEEEKLFQAMFLAENEISEDPISGYGVYQSDSDQMIPHEIHGLGPKLSGLHKIWDWMSNCHFEISFYADLILS